ncbi:hypothetical protein ACRBEV_27195 [Methylobacterium phyllosphaerae]
MLPSDENKLSQQRAKETLSNLLAAFEHLDYAAPGLTLDGLKALIAVALTSLDEGQTRLPDVSKVSRDLNKSLQSASRLIGIIADPKGLALVEGRSGLSGTRSDALALTPQGNKLLSTFLETLTGCEMEQLNVQNFEEFAARKNEMIAANQSEPNIYLKINRYDKATITMDVSPKSEALSEAIQDWCAKNLSGMPTIASEGESVRFRFAKISDAVYFKVHWCWR